MSALFKNNATALLAASISTSGTTLVLAAGTGIKFPVLTGSDFFYGTIYDPSGNYEIVKVTARASDSLTIVRAQEGTTALAFSSGNAFAQRLTAAGLNDFAQKSADNTFSGTNTYTTSNTFSGTFAAANPTFTGTVTIPTPTTGDSTTKAASTAFVTNAITTATGSLGTMSTQNANAVAITGGTITGITDLAVADGGTGASTFTANSVVLGNGTSSLAGNLVAPGATGNVLTSNGTTWSSTAPVTGFTVVSQGEMSVNSTNTFTVSNSKATLLFIYFGNGFGGNSYLYSNVSWGMGSLTDNRTWYASGVDYQVAQSGSMLVGFNAGSGTTVYARVDANFLGGYGAPSTARYTILQF
jgi:hypothetical protein